MEPCISQDLNKQNASLWKHSAFSKALFKKKKKNQVFRFNTTSVYDQKRQSGSLVAKEKLSALEEEIFPAGQGPVVSQVFSLKSSNWSFVLIAVPT